MTQMHERSAESAGSEQELSQILLSGPDTGQLEEEHVLAALRSGWVAPAGPDLTAFENSCAQRTDRSCAVGLSSGTAALHLGLLALGVQPGDAVITATLTFAATANAIVYCGAQPVFIDCEPQTGNMDPDLLRTALSRLRGQNRRVGAVVPVDMLGKCADYDRLLPICAEFGVPVLVDAAESFGAQLDGRPAGSFGQAAVVSFNGNKIMTTSGGGMLLTDDQQLAQRVRHLSTQAREPVAHYEHREVGYNYRLSNILAALGRAQLQRLDEMLLRRREMRELYRDLFADAPGVELFGGAADGGDSCWLSSILVDPAAAAWAPQQLADWLAERSIESRPLWKPMHLQPVFSSSEAFLTGAAERIFSGGLALPSGSALTGAERTRISAGVRAFLAAAPPPR